MKIGDVAEYHFGPELARPYIAPVFAPGGVRVTRAPEEVEDHPHHPGVWVGHRDVDGVDHWTDFPGHGRIVHRSFDGGAERLTWMRPDGKPQLEERRTIALAGDHSFDVEVCLRAEHGRVALGDNKDAAMLAVRVAPWMRTITLAGGLRGEAECWGAAAAWADYSGDEAGVAVFDHPDNPRHPTRWHVRDYGLMCANPTGSRCFGAEADGTLRVAAGDELRFRFRLLAHRGDVDIDAAYEAFAT
jgi:hypothetical protein